MQYSIVTQGSCQYKTGAFKMKQEQNLPLLLNIQQAAQMAHVGRSRAYKFAADGTWPAIKIGRSLRIPRAGLLDWIARMEEEAQDLADERRREIRDFS
ncbi:MAG: helix-turn-helix domain-containing protein [Thermoleophilia bacterium]